MIEKLRSKLVGGLGILGYGVFYSIIFLFAYAPVAMFDLPWYVSWLICLVFVFFPSLTSIVCPILCIIAFPRAVALGLNFLTIVFYISAVLYLYPIVAWIICLIFSIFSHND